APPEGDDAEPRLVIPWWIWLLSGVPFYGVLAYFGLFVRPQLVTRDELLVAATRMILALGLLSFCFESAMILLDPALPVTPLLTIFYWHLVASLFLPWSWRESLKPIVPLLACWFMLRLGMAASDGSWGSLLATLIGMPFLFAPGIAICHFRLRSHQRRFKTGFVGRKFLAMRREFQQARAVHESLFPKPAELDWLRFDFNYRPAADIGGDFIHTWMDADGRFHLALIDVTGHGLASAMSVARIHGEIERLRDEHPDDGPARLLARLNRYFHRLLARHRLYATGVLMSIDPRSGELRCASAGHPPLFLRSRGEVTEIPSTTFLLGAVDGEAFGEDEVVVRLEEGDVLVLFTDGAYDARSPRGDRFGLDRLREILRKPAAPPRWPAYLLRLIDTFEAGMPEDDLLIAEVSFLRRTGVGSITGDDLPVPARRMAEARR
ncbi:MAG: PP2C family protein-serine/threonine phosphatase, partial [Planctomycetota bacterium]